MKILWVIHSKSYRLLHATRQDDIFTVADTHQDHSLHECQHVIQLCEDGRFDNLSRRYQTEALQRSLQENTILFLDTGAGKTLVAILLLENSKERLETPHEKRIAVFLAPTVHLVIQQARVISTHTDLKIGTYYGDKGVDTWSLSKWKEEVDAHQVFVMTPQVFLDALNTSALKMEMVELLIFDECHHAQKRHPYALIMKIHYHAASLKSKPKIFGMTASPVINKGVSSSIGCSLRIKGLEEILDCKLYTLGDAERVELEEFAPTPNHVVKSYVKSTCKFSMLRDELEALLYKHLTVDDMSCTQFGDGVKLKEKMSRSIRELHGSIEYCLSELGLLGASLAADVLLKVDKKERPFQVDPSITVAQRSFLNEVQGCHKKKFLEEASQAIHRNLQEFASCETLQQVRLAKEQGIITSKVELLIDVLTNHRNIESLRCLVFVERVILCIVLAKMLGSFSFLHEFIRCDYIAGANAELCSRTSNQQQQTLNHFMEGQLKNLLVATSVAEEGLDVQKCSRVIRFDLCTTLRSHIQSRGRARKHGSEYIWLVESNNVSQEEQLLQMIEGEKVMKEHVVSRVDMTIEREAPVDDDLEIFRVESGASRSTQDSVAFIYHYCARLPGDRHYTPKPEFTFKETETGYICTLKFPSNAPLNLVEGPPKSTEQHSKKSVCLKACQLLYEIGAVRSDTLCPDIDELLDEDMEQKNFHKAGTNKLKELHPSVKPAAFLGSWLNSPTSVRLQLHVISFTISPSEVHAYSNFGLLTEHVLQDTFDMDLYLTGNRIAKSKLSSHCQIDIDMHQLAIAKAYQEFLINAVFFRSKNDHLKYVKQPYWHESQSYLLLPMNDDDTIDWTSISSTAEASNKFFSHLPLEIKQTSTYSHDPMVATACGLESISKLENSVVIAVHTGKLYCITGILRHLNSYSPFPQKEGEQPITYFDYFKNHYDKALKLPWQPLLEAKQTRSFHNLLSGKSRKLDAGTDDIQQRSEKLPQKNREELPPELCLVLGLNPSVIRSLYLLPSFIFRLTSVLCASQLGSTLGQIAPSLPTSLILQSITSKKCQEDFSYEGLEFLGDSFLKYAVTKRLFLAFDNKHEGQLTAKRSKATCNATLCKLSKKHGFPAYVRTEAFEAAFWICPGIYVLERMLCQHDLTKTVCIDEENLATNEGRACIDGHRWIRSKKTADVIEALIGAYLKSFGHDGALQFMTALNIEVEVEQLLIDSARQRSQAYEAKEVEFLRPLEEKLRYEFQNKALLLEAVTHASHPSSNFCYQRLEFLGDGALDFLISQYLYDSNPELPPGLLTDLRSAAVNNGCFARVAVKHDFHQYLRHGSDSLHTDVTNFIHGMKYNSDGHMHGFEGIIGPKVLADIVESIAGAILVDCGFCLDKLWQAMLPVLSPLVTPENVALHPGRELHEVCCFYKLLKRRDYNLTTNNTTVAKIMVNVEGKDITETAEQKQKEAAKKEAAQKMIIALEGLGYKHPKLNKFKSTLNANGQAIKEGVTICSTSDIVATAAATVTATIEAITATTMATATAIIPSTTAGTETNPITTTAIATIPITTTATVIPQHELRATEEKRCGEHKRQHSIAFDTFQAESTSSGGVASDVAALIDKPGGARSLLYEICSKMRFEQPQFQVKQTEGVPHLRRFKCGVKMNVPGRGVYEECSCFLSDKKKAMDDAAKKMILLLATFGILP